MKAGSEDNFSVFLQRHCHSPIFLSIFSPSICSFCSSLFIDDTLLTQSVQELKNQFSHTAHTLLSSLLPIRVAPAHIHLFHPPIALSDAAIGLITCEFEDSAVAGTDATVT